MVYSINVHTPHLLLPKSGVNREWLSANAGALIELAPRLHAICGDRLDARDDAALRTHLNYLNELLKLICARRLSTMVESLLVSLKVGSESQAVKQKLAELGIELSDLIIGLQMSQTSGPKRLKEGAIHSYHAATSSLTAVKYWLEAFDMDKAMDILNQMPETRDTKVKIASIKPLVKRFSKDEALALVESLLLELSARIAEVTAKNTATKNVMAVDDRPEVLITIREALRDCHVIGVTSAEMALKALDRHKIDLFILDIEMPGVDGFALAKLIRGMEAYRETPLIFLTGNAQVEHVKTAMSLGANDFLVKPSTRETIMTKVGGLLQ